MNFEELMNRLKPKLKAIAWNLDSKYTAFDDDDLYQEALFFLWKKYKANQLSDKTDSFILQGCFFFLKNYIRKVYKKMDANSITLNHIPEEDEQALEEVLPSAALDNQPNMAEFGLLIEDVNKILKRRERKIFHLALGGFTTREIGKRLGISHVMVIKIEKRIRLKCQYIKREMTGA